MCRKFICLVTLISVLSMAAGAANAYLVAYWPMDEGTGTTVGDVTGSWDGTITGDVSWVDGKEGMALEFPGGQNYVNCGNVEIGPDLTLAYWCFNPEKAYERSIGQHSANYTDDPGWCVYSRNGGEGTVWFRVHGVVDTWDGGIIIIPDILPKTEWYHLTFTFEGATRELKGYLDGELKVSKILKAGRSIYPNTNDLRMGHVGTGEPFAGMLDEVAIWNHVLTEDEILAVMEGYIGGANPNASRPTPADGAIHPYTWVNLSWTPGGHAVSHDVYFGDNFDDVNAGTGDTFQGKQAETFFIAGFPGIPYPDGLVPDTTYYWRIDEVNDTEPNSPWKGDVWSFSIPSKTAYTPKHFEITYYDNYNYDTGQWDAWQSDATPRDAWDDKYLADGSSGNTVYTDHAFTSIAVFNLRGNLFSKDGHPRGGRDWNPLKSIGDNVSGQFAHHVFAALFKGLIYLEEGDVLWVASDDDVYVFLDDETKWGQEVLSVPYTSGFDTDSMTVTAAQAGYHMMTVKFIERLDMGSGIEITLNGEHLQNAEVSGFEDFETGNFSKISWWHSGDSNWTISQQEKHSGAYSAEAGTIGDDEYTALEITLECVSGDISFYRKVSSESGFDYLKFYIDGVKKGAWSGEEDWAEVSFQVDEGTRTFEWTYSKDDSVSDGDDAAWIDDIVFPLKINPPIGPEPPDDPNTPDGFDLYLDDIAPGIIESNYITKGLLDYYSEDNPASGDYCIHWTGADLSNMISFRFSPVKDLSVLVDEGFAIDFWVRCDSPNARILIRFMDTNTDDPDDHPWRIIYPIDRNVAVWDGRWNHLQIPLDEFYEQGSHDFDDNRWYNPVGAFDWTATERFEILAEYSDLVGIHFYFDDIRVVDTKPPGRFPPGVR